MTSRVWFTAEQKAELWARWKQARAFRRSRGRWSAGTKVAFSGSYPSMAALLHQQGVERLGRSWKRRPIRCKRCCGDQLNHRPIPVVQGAVARSVTPHWACGNLLPGQIQRLSSAILPSTM